MEPEEIPEEGDTTQTINFKPSFVLIAIDTHPSMFEERNTNVDDDDDEAERTHPFKDALTACYELADSLIFSTSRSNYSQFGVILADEDSKASFIEVESNFLDTVKKLRQKCSLSNEELKAEYERQGDLDLGAFFLLCKKKFKEINSAYYKRTIIFITNNDDPVSNDARRRFTALNEAKTFESSDIHFELIPMNEIFDYTKFYNELFSLYSSPPSVDIVCIDKDALLDKLTSMIVFRYVKLRCKFYPFKNDYERYLKCMKVNFIRTAKLYNTHKASLDGKLLKKLRPEQGVQQSSKADFTLGMGFARDKLNLELKDKYDIYANDWPLGLHLQYVSDRQSEIGVVVNKTSILIVDPKEELTYFDQFWQHCVDKNKVLICIKKYKHPAEIRYVELIPKYANNRKMFLIKDLPFQHELLIPKNVVTAEPPQFETSNEKRAIVNKFIDDATCDYDPKMLINLQLAKKKAYVKAKLLDEPEEEVEDVTADMQELGLAIEDTVNDIKTIFNLPDPAVKKRKGNFRGNGRGKKLSKYN